MLVTTEVAKAWGRLNVPDPLPVVNGLLSATALVRELDAGATTSVHLLKPFTTAS